MLGLLCCPRRHPGKLSSWSPLCCIRLYVQKTHAEPGESLLTGSGLKELKNSRNKNVQEGTISSSWLKCVHVKLFSVIWRIEAEFPLHLAFQLLNISTKQSAEWCHPDHWHNCTAQLTGNEELPKSTCLTPCFVMVFIVLLQELKKIKLTLYQCIIHLDKGLDEMIRIIALEKIAFPYCASVFDCIQQPF